MKKIKNKNKVKTRKYYKLNAGESIHFICFPITLRHGLLLQTLTPQSATVSLSHCTPTDTNPSYKITQFDQKTAYKF